MLMDITFTDREVKMIRIWADSIIHGGHWGDGDAIVPEEDIILKKLQSMEDNKVSLSENEAKIILTWSNSTLGIHTLEEESVIKKLNSLLEQ
jgi:hypothetical protein